MVVAVMKGLNNIAEGLRDYGYDVVTYGEYNHPIDVLVYVGEDSQHINITSNILSEGQPGVLMINATNKNLFEITTILERRLYSPIFTE